MSVENDSETQHEMCVRPKRPFLHFVIGLLLFMAAFGIRCYHITQPPLDFHPMRQCWSFILARAYYFENCESVPEWRRQMAQTNKQMTHIKEPPIMEHLVARAYQFAGAEQLWIPRVFSVTFWLAGGLFLYLLAREMVSMQGALISTAFYLLVPFGIFMSRSFQPEALMVMLFLGSLLAIWRYYNRPSEARLLIAAGVAALAILIKSIAVFPITAGFLFMGIAKQGLRRGLISARCLCFLLACVLLGLGYYFYMTFGPGHLQRVADTIFLPHLLLETSFWVGWLRVAGRTAGYLAVVCGLTGIVLFRNRSDRWLLIGLWVGYFIYGLLFTYTTATHDYYQVLLVPIVALSLGPIGSMIVARLCSLTRRWRWGLAVLGVLMLAGLINMGLNIRHDQFRTLNPNVKSSLEVLCNFIGLDPQYAKRINYDFKEEIMVARQIGEVVNHSTRTIFLAEAYGYPLRYYGELFGACWPRQEDLKVRKQRRLEELNIPRRFGGLMKKWSPEYFIVADLEDFEGQKELKDFLTSRFGVFAESDKYLIFDLTKEIDSGPVRD